MSDRFWLPGERPGRPVELDEERGVWNVYGHAETLQVLTDPATYTSDTGRLMPGVMDDSYREGNLVRMDGLPHRKLRRLVNHAFTPKIVADLEPRIRDLATELLDEVEGRDELELVADLASPLPVIVIAELLGVPSGDRHLFKQWVDKMINFDELPMNDDPEELKREVAAQLAQVQPMFDYLHEHAAERRRRPRQDLLSQLVEAEVDGERLSDNEVVNFVSLLLVAGHITTTMLLGNTVLCLDRDPEQAARVRADRTLTPTAIEESLRVSTPSAILARATETAVELGGQRVPADQMLMLWLSAANRDERVFADPDRFDAGRQPNPHLGFGRGAHFCLGAPLARLEGRIVLNLLLDRFPLLRTIEDRPPTFMPSPELTGVSTLPLRVVD
ncbi:cytochrome P450 [Saccharothrix xinjiangensis]|uniref:Cytochrome P450 n=1 Tax=Saccharothrix xinjiangensis TaxID=204798 RepID=A0ABV9YB34_9PSEU